MAKAGGTPEGGISWRGVLAGLDKDYVQARRVVPRAQSMGVKGLPMHWNRLAKWIRSNNKREIRKRYGKFSRIFDVRACNIVFIGHAQMEQMSQPANARMMYICGIQGATDAGEAVQGARQQMARMETGSNSTGGAGKLGKNCENKCQGETLLVLTKADDIIVQSTSGCGT